MFDFAYLTNLIKCHNQFQLFPTTSKSWLSFYHTMSSSIDNNEDICFVSCDKQQKAQLLAIIDVLPKFDEEEPNIQFRILLGYPDQFLNLIDVDWTELRYFLRLYTDEEFLNILHRMTHPDNLQYFNEVLKKDFDGQSCQYDSGLASLGGMLFIGLEIFLKSPLTRRALKTKDSEFARLTDALYGRLDASDLVDIPLVSHTTGLTSNCIVKTESYEDTDDDNFSSNLSEDDMYTPSVGSLFSSPEKEQSREFDTGFLFECNDS